MSEKRVPGLLEKAGRAGGLGARHHTRLVSRAAPSPRSSAPSSRTAGRAKRVGARGRTTRQAGGSKAEVAADRRGKGSSPAPRVKSPREAAARAPALPARRGEGGREGWGKEHRMPPPFSRPALVSFSAELKPQARIRGGVGGWNHSLLSTPGCALAARKG